MSNNVRTRDGLPFNFEDGLKVRDVDIDTYINAPVITNLSTTQTATTVTVISSTGDAAVIPAATTTTAGTMTAGDKVKLNGIDLSSKQDTLVSGTNIKTINGANILGSGDIAIIGGAGTVSFTPVGNISSNTVQAAVAELDNEKQAALVSGTNIKTINNSSVLGSGNISVQEPLVSGTNIKTINNTSILGSGNISINAGSTAAIDVSVTPGGNISSTNVQTALMELDNEKQPTLVSGTNIKTINNVPLLGSGNLSIVSGESVNKIKIAVIGDSLTAQANLLQETWPTKLQRSLIAFGQDCVVYNLAVIGYTFNDAVNTNTFGTVSPMTPVEMAISLGVDVVIVALGANDTITSDTATVQTVKDNALELFTALNTGLPNAKIIYASQLTFNRTHRPSGTSCLNRDVTNYAMNLRTSGFLTNCYSSLILDDPISSTMSTRFQNWIEVDNYIKSLNTLVDGTFTLDLYKCARLGLVGEDTVHLTTEGANMFCSWAAKAFINIPALATIAPALRTTNYPGYDDADYVFSLFCTNNGTKWVDNVQSDITNHISTNALMLRGVRPHAWAYPSKGALFTGLNTVDENGIAIWSLENVKPNTVVELSQNAGAWANTPFTTTPQGTAVVVQSHGHVADGNNSFYAKVGNEVFGPYSINKLPAPAPESIVAALPWIIFTSTSSQNISGFTETTINGWTTSASGGASGITLSSGQAFTLPAGTWNVSISLGTTLPAGTSSYAKFFTGTPNANTTITASSSHNPSQSTSYGVTAGSGIINISAPTTFYCSIMGTGAMNLNSDNFAHRVSIQKINT